MNETSLRLMEKVKTGISFRSKVFILVLALGGLQMGFMGIHFHSVIENTLEHEVGTRALIQAQGIANDPELIQAVSARNILVIERLINRLSSISDASFIVVGDSKGIRLLHPDKNKIGLPMKGRDNSGALEQGESYISISEGSLGYSVRGKTPIVDRDGGIIGVVSVGYLLNRFDQWIIFYAKPFMYQVIVILVLTLIGAWLFSIHIKKKMNGMEPSEITLALHLKKSILKSVYEGVIAIDKQGKILTINNAALELMGAEKKAGRLKGRSIMEYLTQAQFLFQTPYEENLKDEIVSINGNTLIANRVAMFDQDVLIGWVVSFRHKDEIKSLAAELTQIKQYTDNLTVMRKEHENKLLMISGLIDNGDYESAQALISNENSERQKLNNFINSRFKCEQVIGMLLGKYARSRELGLDLQLDPKSRINNLNKRIDPVELSAVIGSLIDNAFETTLNNPDSNKVISLLITDSGKELVIEIADNGCGIDPELAATIFSRGVTSKDDSEGRGVGLYLINRYVANAGGVILVDDAEPKGTVFSIFIPNNGNT